MKELISDLRSSMDRMEEDKNFRPYNDPIEIYGSNFPKLREILNIAEKVYNNLVKKDD